MSLAEAVAPLDHVGPGAWQARGVNMVGRLGSSVPVHVLTSPLGFNLGDRSWWPESLMGCLLLKLFELNELAFENLAVINLLFDKFSIFASSLRQTASSTKKVEPLVA